MSRNRRISRHADACYILPPTKMCAAGSRDFRAGFARREKTEAIIPLILSVITYFIKKKVITMARIFKIYPEMRKKHTFISERDQSMEVKDKGGICSYITRSNLLFVNQILLRPLDRIFPLYYKD